MTETNVKAVRGTVTEALNGRCTVLSKEGVVDCAVRGVFRKESLFPKAGDKVEFEFTDNNEGNITAVLPRKNEFIRPSVSNVDVMFIVSSVSSPAPNLENIDKMTAICEYSGVTPIIVFTKSDLASASEFERIYALAGYKTVTVSNESEKGIEEIKEILNGKIAVFTGYSGVGKSSLINRICPEANSEVGDLSEKISRGKNTTRRATLFKCQNGFVADTPGFSSLDLTMCIKAEKEDIKDYFPEIAEKEGSCKFANCLHLPKSKGCAVCEAVLHGEIPESRYNSYLRFYELFKDKMKY